MEKINDTPPRVPDVATLIGRRVVEARRQTHAQIRKVRRCHCKSGKRWLDCCWPR